MQAPLRLLGYVVRRTEVPAGWRAAAPNAEVEDICSVADCVAERPDGWVQRWDFNRASFYGTEAAARATTNDAGGFQVLGYALVTMKVTEAGGEVALDPDQVLTHGLPELPTEPVADGFVVIGYDVVSRQSRTDFLGFECSPLSCCGLAGEVGVNRHCLIDDVAAALLLARHWDLEQPEPGPYYVVQVLRR